MRARKCKRGRGGCGRLCGRWVLAGASFGPMAAISRRGQGGRIYNNTRVRELLRRKCVKPADLTTHSPPKTSSRPRTATRPSRTLPLPHAAPTHARRLRDAFPADRTTHSPPKTFAPPRTAIRPSRALPLPHAAPMHAHAAPTHAPPPSQPILRRRPPLAPAQRHALPEHFRSPTQRRPASPSVPLRAQKNGTAQWMCDAECLGRPSLRSVIGVGEPRAVRRRCGALACRRGA